MVSVRSLRICRAWVTVAIVSAPLIKRSRNNLSSMQTPWGHRLRPSTVCPDTKKAWTIKYPEAWTPEKRATTKRFAFPGSTPPGT